MLKLYKKAHMFLGALLGISLTTMPVQADVSDGAILAIAAAAAAAAATSGDDSEVAAVASIAYQQKRLKFDTELRFPVGGGGPGQFGTDAEFDVDLPTLNTSLTLAYKKMFATFKYETSIEPGIAEVEETLQPSEESYYYNIPGESTEVEREDMSLTIGYNVVNTLNVFAGYMKGETEITPKTGCSWKISDPAQTCDTSFNPNGLVNIAWVMQLFTVPGASDYQHTYEEEGFFTGVSYAWQIAEAGVLSTSFAYAIMDGTYSDNAILSFASGIDFELEGTSKGASLGLTWTAPLGETSNYFIDLRRQQYDMSAKDSNGHFPGGEAETEEIMESLTAGIQYYF